MDCWIWSVFKVLSGSQTSLETQVRKNPAWTQGVIYRGLATVNFKQIDRMSILIILSQTYGTFLGS